MGESANRRVRVALLAALVVALAALQVTAAFGAIATEGDNLAVVLVEVAFPVALALGLVVWLRGREVAEDDVLRVSVWAALAVIGAVALTTLGFGRELAVVESTRLWVVTLGSLAALMLAGGVAQVSETTERLRRREFEQRYRSRAQRREQELREAREKFSAVVADIEDYAIVTLDAAGRVTSWNQGAERIQGYAAHEIRGEHIRRFFPVAARRDRTPDRLLAEAARSGRVEDEGWRIRADGSRFWADVVISALRDDDGDTGRFVMLTRDATERRQRVRRLQVLYRVLRHNLRNDMTVVGGYAGLIAEDVSDPEIAEYADTIARTADRVGQLSQRVQQTVDPETTDPQAFRDLVATVTDSFGERYPDSTFVTAITDGPVRVDGRVETALTHVVENALEHHDGAPHVRIRVVEEEVAEYSRWRVTVEDDGPGIPDQERRAVVEGEVTALNHGSGLGLWVAKWVIESIGGDLTLGESDLGGTSVEFVLPTVPTGDRAADGALAVDADARPAQRAPVGDGGLDAAGDGTPESVGDREVAGDGDLESAGDGDLGPPSRESLDGA